MTYGPGSSQDLGGTHTGNLKRLVSGNLRRSLTPRLRKLLPTPSSALYLNHPQWLLISCYELNGRYETVGLFLSYMVKALSPRQGFDL